MTFLVGAVIFVHFFYVAFVLFGGLVLLWRFGFWKLHISFALWGAGMMLEPGAPCPLTALENWLRPQAGMPIYEVGFVAHHIIGPSGVVAPKWLPFVIVVGLNLFYYGLGWWRRSNGR